MAFSDAYARGAAITANREAVREQKRQRDQELQMMGYSFDENNKMSVRPGSAADAAGLQALEATQLSRSLQGKLAAQETDQAFEDFSATGDASYLQRALDNNPYLKKSWGDRGVQLINSLDFENDSKLLANAGVQPAAYDTPDKRDILKRNMYKVYNGKEWALGLLNQAVMETGAVKRLGPRRSEGIINNYDQLQQLLRGPKSSGITAEGHKYEQEITTAANETGLPADLIAAVLQTESSGKADAVSSKGASGLMQLMPDTAKELGVKNINDPAENILGGAKYLKQQLDAHGGDLQLALAAYNAGPGNVKKYGGIPPFNETQNYVQKVVATLDNGQRYYGRRADTILDHMRSKANAEQGKTNAQVDAAVQSDLDTAAVNRNVADRGIDQADRALNQADRQIDQADRELDLKAEGNQIEILKQKVKMVTDGKTTEQKNLDAAVDRTTELLTEFGGEDEFFNTDFTKPENYNKAYKYVNQIEQLSNETLSDADKKNINDLRKLVTLSDPATALESNQVGLIDTPWKNFTKYFKDEAKGVYESSARQALIQTMRNAMYGASLTGTEKTDFAKAYGNDKQQLGPVLQQMKVAISQIRSDLESTSNLMNPYTAHVRLGGDREKLTNIVKALDERIMLIDDTISGTGGERGQQAVLNAFEGE